MVKLKGELLWIQQGVERCIGGRESKGVRKKDGGRIKGRESVRESERDREEGMVCVCV